MLTTPVDLVTAASMGADIESASQQTTNMFGFSIQAVYAGSSPTGSLKLQGSLDQVTWNDIDDYSESISQDGSALWNVTDAMYPYVRVFYDYTSGTGVLDVKFFGKGF